MELPTSGDDNHGKSESVRGVRRAGVAALICAPIAIAIGVGILLPSGTNPVSVFVMPVSPDLGQSGHIVAEGPPESGVVEAIKGASAQSSFATGGASAAVSGAEQLADGSAILSDGTAKLSAGLAQLDSGIGIAGAGASQVSAGVDQLAGAVRAVAVIQGQVMTAVDDATTQLSGADPVVVEARSALSQLRAQLAVQGLDQSALKQLDELQGGARELRDQLATSGQLRSGVSVAAGAAKELNAGAAELQEGAATLKEGTAKVDASVDRVDDAIRAIAVAAADSTNGASSGSRVASDSTYGAGRSVLSTLGQQQLTVGSPWMARWMQPPLLVLSFLVLAVSLFAGATLERSVLERRRPKMVFTRKRLVAAGVASQAGIAVAAAALLAPSVLRSDAIHALAFISLSAALLSCAGLLIGMVARRLLGPVKAQFALTALLVVQLAVFAGWWAAVPGSAAAEGLSLAALASPAGMFAAALATAGNPAAWVSIALLGVSAVMGVAAYVLSRRSSDAAGADTSSSKESLKKLPTLESV